MTADPTEPHADDCSTGPISSVESRVIPRRALPATTVDPLLAQARRMLTALAAAAADPPLRLAAEFDLVGVGRLRTTTLENFALSAHPAAPATGFTLSFDYRGRDALTHVCASDRVFAIVRKKLFDHGLAIKAVASATANKLTVEPIVSAAVSFALDQQSQRVCITLRNVVMLGVVAYEIPRAGLERKLVDAVIDLITAQSRTFYALLAAARQGFDGR